MLDRSEDRSIKEPSKEQSRAQSKLQIKSKDSKKLIPKTKKKIESIPSLDISAIEEKNQDENIMFDVPEWEPEVKQEFQVNKNEIVKFIQNQISDQMNTVLFKDPVYDELKKDQKPVKAPPKAVEEKIEEKPKTGDPDANKDLVLHDGNIIKT